MRSDIIAKAIDKSITKTSLNKLMLHPGVYEWTYAKGPWKHYDLPHIQKYHHKYKDWCFKPKI